MSYISHVVESTGLGTLTVLNAMGGVNKKAWDKVKANYPEEERLALKVKPEIAKMFNDEVKKYPLIKRNADKIIWAPQTAPTNNRSRKK